MWYEEQWKNEGFKNRCVRFIIDKKSSNDIKELYLNLTEKCNHLSKIIFDRIKSCQYTKESFKNDKTLELELQKEFRKTWNFPVTYFERSVTRPVIKRYKAYFERNDKPINQKIIFRLDKAIMIYDKIFKFEKDNLYMRNLKKEWIKIEYYIPKRMKKKLPFLLKSMSGNLIPLRKNRHKNDFVFIARTIEKIHWKYQPVGAIGFDIGKRDDIFLYWSNNTCKSRSKELQEIGDKIKDLCSKINNKKKKDKTGKPIEGAIKTKDRRKLRYIWKNEHKKQDKKIQPYVNELIKYAVDNQLLVCIDDLTTGASLGTYGQDKVKSQSIKYCEDNCIPFIKVPTYHTSEMCHKCNSQCIRDKDFKETTCPNCGKMNADYNGAKNIERFGQKIWNNGSEGFYSWKKPITNKFIKKTKRISKSKANKP